MNFSLDIDPIISWELLVPSILGKHVADLMTSTFGELDAAYQM